MIYIPRPPLPIENLHTLTIELHRKLKKKKDERGLNSALAI